MTIATFKPKEKPKPKVWQCDCGCENFWLYEDGQIECVECNTFHHSMTGHWKIIELTGPIRFRVRQDDGTYLEVPNAVTEQEAGEDDGSGGS